MSNHRGELEALDALSKQRTGQVERARLPIIYVCDSKVSGQRCGYEWPGKIDVTRVDGGPWVDGYGGDGERAYVAGQKLPDMTCRACRMLTSANFHDDQAKRERATAAEMRAAQNRARARRQK